MKPTPNSMLFDDYDWSVRWYRTGLDVLETTIRCYGKGMVSKEDMLQVMRIVKRDKEIVQSFKSRLPLIPNR